jgi:hypothetical protein
MVKLYRESGRPMLSKVASARPAARHGIKKKGLILEWTGLMVSLALNVLLIRPVLPGVIS